MILVFIDTPNCLCGTQFAMEELKVEFLTKLAIFTTISYRIIFQIMLSNKICSELFTMFYNIIIDFSVSLKGTNSDYVLGRNMFRIIYHNPQLCN